MLTLNVWRMNCLVLKVQNEAGSMIGAKFKEAARKRLQKLTIVV